jgi:hypothetical protein
MDMAENIHASNSPNRKDSLRRVVDRKFEVHEDSILLLPPHQPFDTQCRPYNTSLKQENLTYRSVEQLTLNGATLLKLSRVVLPEGYRSKPTISFNKGLGIISLPWEQSVTPNEDDEWVYDFSQSTQEWYKEKIHPVRKRLLTFGVITGRPL